MNIEDITTPEDAIAAYHDVANKATSQRWRAKRTHAEALLASEAKNAQGREADALLASADANEAAELIANKERAIRYLVQWMTGARL